MGRIKELDIEIQDLLEESEKLRNLMSALESQEAIIAGKISLKRKQVDTQMQFNFEKGNE